MWDLHEEEVKTPCISFRGPRRNIFVLSFSANDRYLFSGGTDDLVLKFDASTQLERPLNPQPPGSPNWIFRQHKGSIRAIAPHSVQDEIFLSGSEDGRIFRHDGRAAPNARIRAQDTIQLMSEVTGVEFHPVMEHIFATSEAGGRVCLRDLRMAFGPLVQRTGEGIVHSYHTKLSRRRTPSLSNPETLGISFNRQGTQLAVTMLHYFPTIYNLMDSDPVAVCSAPNLPDGSPVPRGESTYENSCSTMKQGSFGGPGLDVDTLYAAGSDDFRAYIWSLPPPAALAAQRTFISYEDWDAGAHSGIVAFAERTTGPRCVPAQLQTPCGRLGGHASVVNTALIHPQMLLVASAGIEAGIVLHGAVDSLLGGMEPTSPHTRKVGELLIEAPGDEDETIQIFDLLLRDEAGADVFELRQWSESDSDDSSDSDGESDSDDDAEMVVDF